MIRLQTAIHATVALILLAGQGVVAFYLPGVNPQSFEEGDVVKLKVNKMTSSRTLLPVDYYHLPFCQPEGGPKMDNQNIGQFLSGDRIVSSPYRLQMTKDMYCEQLCISNLGRAEQRDTSPNKVVKAIRNGNHNNWIIDNLPAATKVENENSITIRYWKGFPVGFVAEDTKKAYIHNHVNIEIMYHPVEIEANKFRIVRFTVEPFSIKHDVEDIDEGDDQEGNDAKSQTYIVAKIINPIFSCDPKSKEKVHTNFDMTTAKGRTPQEASGKVLFTYDVIWVKNKDVPWASRWDIYLSMDDAIPARVHWLSIANSLIVVVLLATTVVAIFVCNLRRDRAQYNRLLMDEENVNDVENFEWKRLHADVFRPPNFSPLLLSVACGTGAQILCTTFLTILFLAMGFLNPSRRGSLVMAVLFLFAIMGSVAGYVTARFYKTFKGKSRKQATILTALGFSGIAFFSFVVMAVLAWIKGSTYAIPFTTIASLLILWFGISIPMVLAGAHFGYKQDAIDFPVKTRRIPRQIPDQRWYRSLWFALVIGGILPFCCCFVELYFIMGSIWMDQYYYTFGYLLLVFCILLIVCTEISVLVCFSQLCGGNYQWWWRSFATSGSVALYVFAYSLCLLSQLEVNSFVGHVIYVGYMALVSLGLFLMTGFVGVVSSLWFNKAIFSSVNIE